MQEAMPKEINEDEEDDDDYYIKPEPEDKRLLLMIVKKLQETYRILIKKKVKALDFHTLLDLKSIVTPIK